MCLSFQIRENADDGGDVFSLICACALRHTYNGNVSRRPPTHSDVAETNESHQDTQNEMAKMMMPIFTTRMHSERCSSDAEDKPPDNRETQPHSTVIPLVNSYVSKLEGNGN